CELRYLSRNEKHCRSVLTSRYTGTTTDTGRRFESLVSDAFWNRNSVGIWYATSIDIDITAGLLDAFERGTVYGQILQHRESCSSPRLDNDGLAIVKATHVQLTGSCSLHRAMWLTIDN